jgi:hypothetical protein
MRHYARDARPLLPRQYPPLPSPKRVGSWFTRRGGFTVCCQSIRGGRKNAGLMAPAKMRPALFFDRGFPARKKAWAGYYTMCGGRDGTKGCREDKKPRCCLSPPCPTVRAIVAPGFLFSQRLRWPGTALLEQSGGVGANAPGGRLRAEATTPVRRPDKMTRPYAPCGQDRGGGA